MSLQTEPQSAGNASSAKNGPIRVMVVDDSAVVRGLITRMIEEDAALSVIASVGNGQAAVQALDRHEVEVVILDIEMPVMDGLTALPKLLEKDPKLKVIMASTLTTKNAEISLQALENGAADYVPKPTSSREISGGLDFKRDLIEKVRTLGAVRRGGPIVGISHRPAAALTAVKPGIPPSTLPGAGGGFTLRQPGNAKPDIIAIGSSTGGPQALFKVLSGLRASGPVAQPIVITQHMPPTFTTILAEHVSRLSGFTACEAKDGQVLKGGEVYIAPGDFHMTVEQKGTDRVLRTTQGPPVNFCRPAVDPMFHSLIKVYGNRILALVLTGMGADGAKGALEIAEAGGSVVAQDEATSVVWGMPGATAVSGACCAVLPIDEIAPKLKALATRGT